MSQSAKNNPSATVVASAAAPIVFQSEVGLFLVYLLVRTLPLVAVVFYFTTWVEAALTALGLVLLLLWTARRHNHRFTVHATHLEIAPSFWPFSKPHTYSYKALTKVAVKIAHRGDRRQWITLHTTTQQTQRYRCDWLHQQDPPSVDEHDDDGPQHELFDLLDEEDFYEGSIQHLVVLLQKKGVLLQPVVS
jgi:hypothetical protein